MVYETCNTDGNNENNYSRDILRIVIIILG